MAVELAEVSGEAVLGIADDGGGIPLFLQERVFERFARVDEARVTSANGTGLGLSIAREIVTAHGGTITIDPTHSDGARFLLRLPSRLTPRTEACVWIARPRRDPSTMAS